MVNFTKKITSIGAIDLSYVERGSGFPLLMFHGVTSSSMVFFKTFDILSKSHRVLALDLIGYGDSSFNQEIDLKDYLLLLGQFIDGNTNGQIDLLGHSMGSMLAVQFAYHFPEKIRKLVLSSFITPPLLLMKLGKNRTLSSLIAKLMNNSNTKDPEKFRKSLKYIFHNPDKLDDMTLEILAEETDKSRGNALSLRLLSGSSETYASILKNLTCPMLIIAGEKDPLVRKRKLKKMAKSINESNFFEISKTGHMPMLEQPQLYCEKIIDFLNR